MTLRVGIVGCGQIAKRHLAQFRALGEATVRIAAVYDNIRERAESFAQSVEEQLGYRPNTPLSFRSLIRSNIQGVMVTTPHPVHAEMAFDILRAGKHAYVEKPIGTSRQWEMVQEIKREATERSKRQVLVVTPFDHFPDVMEAHRICLSRLLGQVLGGEAFKFNPGPQRAWYYRRETAHDGALFDAAIYGVSLFTRLFGRASNVSAKLITGGSYSKLAEGVVHADVDTEAELTMVYGTSLRTTVHAGFSGFDEGTRPSSFERDITLDSQSIRMEGGTVFINGVRGMTLNPVPPLLVQLNDGAEPQPSWIRRTDLESNGNGRWFGPPVKKATLADRQIGFFVKCMNGTAHPDLDRTFQIAETLHRARGDSNPRSPA